MTYSDPTKRLLKTAVADYLDEIKLTKKPKTLAAYTIAMDYFTESCSKVYLEDIERKDLLKFAAFLRDEKEQAPRSVHNKFANVMGFLKAQGIRGLMGKNDWPQYTEEEAEVYEHEELDTLFAACDAEERDFTPVVASPGAGRLRPRVEIQVDLISGSSSWHKNRVTDLRLTSFLQGNDTCF